MRKFLLSSLLILTISTNIYADGLPQNNWTTLENIIATAEPLSLKNGEKTSYVKGEKLQLGIRIEKAGYLNVVSVTETGETTVLFPNKYHQNNKVNAGIFILPTAQMKFEFTAQAPFGKTLVAAFLTNHSVNLYQQAKTKGVGDDIFQQLNATQVQGLSKAIGVTATEGNAKDKVKAGKIELMTCETAEGCQ